MKQACSAVRLLLFPLVRVSDGEMGILNDASSQSTNGLLPKFFLTPFWSLSVAGMEKSLCTTAFGLQCVFSILGNESESSCERRSRKLLLIW